MASVERLKVRLARTLKAKKIVGALEAISALAEMEPDDPVWPKRAARLLRATDDVKGQLDSLRHALSLQLDQSLVLDAIATCKTILEVAPDDERALDCLDRLHLHRDSEAGLPEFDLDLLRLEKEGLGKENLEREGREEQRRGGAGREKEAANDQPVKARRPADAPLDSMLLRTMVPGARSVSLGDAEPGDVNEIPVDPGTSHSGEEVVDLRLEEWSPSADLGDIAAAQAVSLPRPTELERSQATGSNDGASLRRELANIPLFGDLDPTSLHTLIRRVRVVQLTAGQVLFRQGDAANSLYVIVDGAVVPIAEEDRRCKLAVLERGEFFGEIGLLTKQPRNATIEALVDTKLLAIDRRVLWDLIDKKPSVATSILRFLRARLIDRQIRTNLFFAAFAHAERTSVASQFRILEVADGARIVAQGAPPEGLFVVLSGSLERFDRRLEKQLGTLEPGDVFGGLSLLEGKPSLVDVIARGKCWLVVLGEARFRRIVDANPRLIRVLERLEESETSRARTEKCSAV